MLRWILKNIETAGLEKNNLRKIEIASEEALVNIINHAYQGKSDEIIHINVVVSEDFIELRFLDNGPEFNPVKVVSVNEKDATLEERPLGGLGLVLIKKYMDKVSYERKDCMNILTLTKNINY